MAYPTKRRKTRDGKVWAMVLSRVAGQLGQSWKRLDDVCGRLAGVTNIGISRTTAVLRCGISIKIDSEWVTKWDAAENTQVKPSGGRSGAMKRAACRSVKLVGICITLRKVLREVSSDKKQGWHRARSARRMEQDFTETLHRCRTGPCQHQAINHRENTNQKCLHRLTANKSERLQRLCSNRN